MRREGARSGQDATDAQGKSAGARAVAGSSSLLDRLWARGARRAADPAISHSARLLSRGTAKVAQKFGEEAVECLIEAVAKQPEGAGR